MYLIDNLGWFSHAHRCPSSNFNQRPPGEDVSLLVIHNISLPPGQFGTSCVQAFFCNELDCHSHPQLEELSGVNVSAHLFIDRSGGCFQFVSLLDRAWHAGVSSFEGRENCNDFSVGIELEGEDILPSHRRAVSRTGCSNSGASVAFSKACAGEDHRAQ